MDTLQVVKDYIAKEQTAGLDRVKQHEQHQHIIGDEYLHGYYSGYLTALYNLKLLITQAESEIVKP